MTLTESSSKYPALMAYIANRNALATTSQWCDQLSLDKAGASKGAFAEVAEEMKQAQADYGAYPYNSAMGEFLGLPIKPTNHEPEHGYYMAGCVMHHYALFAAQQKARELIESNKPLRIVVGREKKTRKPIRFATFVGPDQIQIHRQTVKINNGKRSFVLSSNWSTETCIVSLVAALESGQPFGA